MAQGENAKQAENAKQVENAKQAENAKQVGNAKQVEMSNRMKNLKKIFVSLMRACDDVITCDQVT